MDKGFVYILASVLAMLVMAVGSEIESGRTTGINLALSTTVSVE
jgi:hypothetical protein